MSTNLYWRPVKRDNPTKGCGIKWALHKRYGFPVQVRLSHSDVPYLEGIRDVSLSTGGDSETAEDAQELINAIHDHDTIEVYEQE